MREELGTNYSRYQDLQERYIDTAGDALNFSAGELDWRRETGSIDKNPLRKNPVRQHPPNAAVASLGSHLRRLQQTGPS